MKAIITNYGELGLRILSEGANDVVLMEMLQSAYPGILRRTDAGQTMDLRVPIERYDLVPDGGSMKFATDVPVLSGESFVVSEANHADQVIRSPLFVVDGPGDWYVWKIEINGRAYCNYEISDRDASQDGRFVPRGSVKQLGVDLAKPLDTRIVPGAVVSVSARYLGTDPGGRRFVCEIRSTSVADGEVG